MKKLVPLLFGGPGAATVYGDVALAVLRVSLGVYIAAHGLQKVPVTQDFIQDTEALGFTIMPAFFAWSAALTELIGGLVLAVGLLTRPIALLLVFNMGVAAFVAHADAYWVSGQGRQNVREMAMLYLIPFLAFAVLGAGRTGIDSVIRKRK